MPLSMVEPRRLYQVVADQIVDAIRAGEFRPGDRLPPERDLSGRCGVSRPVVREAMIALEIAGLVEVRGGSGVFVRAVPAAMGGVPDAGEDPYEAFLARRVIESEIAAIAAENAKPSDVAEIESALECMRAEAGRGRGPDQHDRRFHLAVAQATGNVAFVKIIHFIWDELIYPGKLWTKLFERRFVRPTRIAEHEAILEAIASGSPEAARAAMHTHFDGAIRDFLERSHQGFGLPGVEGRGVAPGVEPVSSSAAAPNVARAKGGVR
jgi:GntR family transcriptional regulator, uxu operon transcriptional repressor